MVNFYVYRAKNGLKKWTAVPTLWREEVKKERVAPGYVLNDDGTVSSVGDEARIQRALARG
mgnify:FL=1